MSGGVLDAGLGRLHERLAASGLPLFVGGSVARSTLDLDLVVRAAPPDAPRIAAAFPPAGFHLPPLEVMCAGEPWAGEAGAEQARAACRARPGEEGVS